MKEKSVKKVKPQIISLEGGSSCRSLSPEIGPIAEKKTPKKVANLSKSKTLQSWIGKEVAVAESFVMHKHSNLKSQLQKMLAEVPNIGNKGKEKYK